ncbi:MAG: hypothetical protein CMF69_05060 [Magnetovibrio sp.]|nr:hypothetical protein [Magnetovibrio sp.]
MDLKIDYQTFRRVDARWGPDWALDQKITSTKMSNFNGSKTKWRPGQGLKNCLFFSQLEEKLTKE